MVLTLYIVKGKRLNSAEFINLNIPVKIKPIDFKNIIDSVNKKTCPSHISNIITQENGAITIEECCKDYGNE